MPAMNDVAAPQYTPDDLLRLPDADSYELVDGHLVEKHMGGESSFVGAEILYRVRQYLETNPLGKVLGADGGYRCFPHRPRLVRKPDVSFVRLARLPGERIPNGDITIPPDLAVDVRSANDLHNAV